MAASYIIIASYSGLGRIARTLGISAYFRWPVFRFGLRLKLRLRLRFRLNLRA